MLPDVRGLRVLDLGCGFGWFCRWARGAGAARVVGIDLSERMLERARTATSDAAITYQTGDLEHIALPQAQFDLVYSSLAFHYVADAGRLFAQIHCSLVPSGRLVFSTEHPIYMAPRQPRWMIGEDGHKSWPVDQYLIEGPRTTNWLADGVVKHHRTIGTTLNLLIASGFVIERVDEFCPTAEQIAANPALAEEVERPMFLLVSACRRAA
jgi:SAM-dependent methyltransferase